MDKTQESNIKEATQPMGIGGGLCNTAREKYWDELSIEKKIERTRQMVKRTMNIVIDYNNRLEQRLRILESKFDSHQHSNINNHILYSRMETSRDICCESISKGTKEHQDKIF